MKTKKKRTPIIIDTNNLSRVFNSENTEHEYYKSVLNAFKKGEIEIVFGGTKFMKEISGVTSKTNDIYKFKLIENKFRAKLIELKKVGRVVEENNEKIDKEHVKIVKKFIESYRENLLSHTIFVPENELKRVEMVLKKLRKKIFTEIEKSILIDELVIKPDFDDPHLIALLNKSNCRNICTDEKRAGRFLKIDLLYDNLQIPKIHSTKALKKGLKLKTK